MDSNTVRVLVFDWHWKLLGERTISVDDQALLPNNQLAWHRLCTVTMENIGVPYREIEHLHISALQFEGPVTQEIIDELKAAYDAKQLKVMAQYHTGLCKPSEAIPTESEQSIRNF
jgi:hypothetical protein